MKYIAIKILAMLLLTMHANSQEQTPVKPLPLTASSQTESHYPNLKEIEWLIGTWEDQAEDVTILVNGQWDKYKNFILQHFEWKVEDRDELELKQIIGWDPIQQKIRSWVFDSDGGFGEGLWTKVNDQWHVKMIYTLPDGRKGSATNVYAKNDNNSYSFSSFGREIDGEVLPNIKPTKLTKKQ